MSTDRTLLGLLLLIALVIGSNLILYGIARSVSRGDGRWLQALTRTFNKPLAGRNEAMDELRRRVQDLSGEHQNKPEP